jgi:glucokinase
MSQPIQLLAGDIGGTKTILRLVQADPALTLLHEERYSSHSFPDLVPMVQRFLSAAGGQPQRACFAIAGPVVHNTSQLTNLGWTLEADRLSAELNLEKVSLINDFAAVGYGVLGLQPADVLTLQAGSPEANAPIGVIGAGTGLGQGFLVQAGDAQPSQYQVFSSEGGHADFAPRSEQEFQLAQYLLEKYGIDRLSVERVVSGQGILAIYQFLRDRYANAEDSTVGSVVATWESQLGQGEKTVDPAAAIAQAALSGGDRLSTQALQMFIAAYGAEAGNLALKLLPYGGLYIAGGIAAKILPLMQDGRFLAAFHHKGRMRPLMERVPVHVVLNPQVGLIGAAVCAARL